MIDVLAFGAHPDDIEFGCGGILAKMHLQKKSIALVDLTSGDKGTKGDPELRREEGRAAAKLIGAERIFLDFKDCEIIDSYEGRLELVKIIRHFKPKLILGPPWKGDQNHPDHTACGQMLRYAARYARFSKILPDLAPHKIDGILHYAHPCHDEVDFLVDVSPVVEIWKAMMLCHRSQMQTYPYSDWCLRYASKQGILLGVEYAQGLLKGNPIIIDDPMTVSRGIREI